MFHDEWVIVTDDNFAFLDVFVERTTTPDCSVTVSLAELER